MDGNLSNSSHTSPVAGAGRSRPAEEQVVRLHRRIGVDIRSVRVTSIPSRHLATGPGLEPASSGLTVRRFALLSYPAAVCSSRLRRAGRGSKARNHSRVSFDLKPVAALLIRRFVSIQCLDLNFLLLRPGPGARFWERGPIAPRPPRTDTKKKSPRFLQAGGSLRLRFLRCYLILIAPHPRHNEPTRPRFP